MQHLLRTMRYKLLFPGILVFMFSVQHAFAQAAHSYRVARSNSRPVKAADGFPAKRLVYQLSPTTGPASGLLVLLPGRGEPASDVFRATSLAQQAVQQGFRVLVPALNNRRYLDAASTHFLDDIIGDAVRQQPGLGGKLLIGGFSAGGQLAFTYAEQLVRDSLQRPWRVRAVLGVDPPLDLTDHWQRAQYHLAKHDCAPFAAADQNTIRELTRDMGGSPAQFAVNYLTRTAFTRSDAAGGNAQWLVSVPVRIYCEPDLSFWQQTCPVLEKADLNADGGAALITFLQSRGNTRATFIETTGKGFVGKQRMPHSWSIVDAVECAAWLKACL